MPGTGEPAGLNSHCLPRRRGALASGSFSPYHDVNPVASQNTWWATQMFRTLFLFLTAILLGGSQLAACQSSGRGELRDPVRLEADGKPINIFERSHYGHAGPAIGDIDGDGDRDLLVGDFPGQFWLFENTGNDQAPVYAEKGKWQAGGVDAKTPVY
jgi:hypothetical protein